MQGLPEEFNIQIKKQLNDQYPEFLNSLKEEPPVSIRINPKKYPGEITNPVPWSKLGSYLAERPIFTLDPLFHAGMYYVQEASSMFLEHVFNQTIATDSPLKVLDLCAAPGGKSTHLVSLLSAESLLVSNEVIRTRSNILSENLQKWGYPNCIITNNDPKDFASLSGVFDVIVVDAPCSGEGLFRKDPGAADQWSPEAVELCSARQKRILHDVWPALKENGLLIYCTCTYNRSENEDNLLWLKNEHNVEFVSLKIDPQWRINEVHEKEITGYRFFPHQIKGEGFFTSVIRKKENSDLLRKSKGKLNTALKRSSETLKTWILDAERFKFFQHHDLIFSFPETHAETLDTLLHHLHVIYAGTNLASAKHDKLIPEHSLALSVQIDQSAHHTVQIDHQQAIQYLRKEAIQVDEIKKGYALLKFEHLPIGWVNLLHNRANNMYPQEWRIRMARPEPKKGDAS